MAQKSRLQLDKLGGVSGHSVIPKSRLELVADLFAWFRRFLRCGFETRVLAALGTFFLFSINLSVQ